MFKFIPILLLPFLLLSQSEMKCEAGKCGDSKSEMKKIIKLTKPLANDTKQKNNKKTSAKPTIEQLFNITTVQVKKISTARKQINYGYIVAQDSLKVDVFAWYSGFVTELYADTLYKKVQKGDALVKVYSPEVYKAKQDYLNSIHFNATRSTPAMLKSAKTKLELLGISHQEIEDIKKSRKVDEYTMVYAPVSGWIFEKNINQGASFNSKMKLFQIIDLKKVWLEAKLFQNELTRLKYLQDFKVSIKGIEKMFTAQKELLYPMIDTKEATITLRLSIDNAEELLKPGMYAKLHSNAQKDTKLVIPRTAAMRKSGTWYVFLATEFKGEYEPLEVKLQPLDNKHYEITKGLNTGDIIVNNALFMMDSDAQINSLY